MTTTAVTVYNMAFALEHMLMKSAPQNLDEWLPCLLRLRSVSHECQQRADDVGMCLLSAKVSRHGVHRSTAVAMSRCLGAPGGVPWSCAFAWWKCVEHLVSIPWIKIAGSAALFVERCLSNQDPGFTPGDIDLWVEGGRHANESENDPPNDTIGCWGGEWDGSGVRSLAGALTLFDALARMEETEAEFMRFNLDTMDTFSPLSNFQAASYRRCLMRFIYQNVKMQHDDMCSLDPIPHKVIVSCAGGLEVTLQIMFSAYDNAVRVCQCDTRHEGCAECIPVKDGDGYGIPGWPRGLPHSRFDLDAACVALERDPGTNQLVAHRLGRGSATGPDLTLLAPGLWRLRSNEGTDVSMEEFLAEHDSDYAVQIDMNILTHRINKYRSRGYSRITVADSITIAGHTLCTPDWVKALCNN